MKKTIEVIKKILSSNYFLFFFSFFLVFISIYNVNIVFNSGDANETLKVVETFFSKEHYGSYVMYKGIYSFIPGVISYVLSNIFNVSELLFLKIFKSLSFAYISVMAVPFLTQKTFNNNISTWQKYLFIIVLFILERASVYLVSVDLLSSLILILLMIQIIKVLEKNSLIRLFFIGLLTGIGISLSGQYTPSSYILLLYLIIVLICKYKKEIKKLIVILLVLLLGVVVTKSINTYYEHSVVDELRNNGAWIPTGHDWFIHSLSGGMNYVNFPVMLTDDMSLSFTKNYNEEYYNIIVNNGDAFTVNEYVDVVVNHPQIFIVRWVERLYLGLINDPLNSFGISFNHPFLVLIFMSIALYVCWYFVKENVKNVKDLITLPSIMFYSIMFSAIVPSFRHVENRYYLTARICLIALLLLSPLLSNFIDRIKKKDISFCNINMNIITCLVFVVISVVVYFVIYRNSGYVIQLF